MNLIHKTSIPLFAAAMAFAFHADAHNHEKPASPAAVAADMVEGEVRKVDKEAGKVTLKHGAIKNLDMPPMTMVFRVKEPDLLDRIKAGDKIRFEAEKVNGQFTVTKAEVVR